MPIIENFLSTVTASFGVIQTPDWMLFIGNYGGILLTFLAGTEIDTELIRYKIKKKFFNRIILIFRTLYRMFLIQLLHCWIESSCSYDCWYDIINNIPYSCLLPIIRYCDNFSSKILPQNL